VNPSPGAQFYPFFSTTSGSGSCTWREGGNYLPGTTNNFGGSSATEFGPLLKTVYPITGFTPEKLFDNFKQRQYAQSLPSRVRAQAAHR
jgi:hypothetical protein